jgi:hypothetical protein
LFHLSKVLGFPQWNLFVHKSVTMGTKKGKH